MMGRIRLYIDCVRSSTALTKMWLRSSKFMETELLPVMSSGDTTQQSVFLWVDSLLGVDGLKTAGTNHKRAHYTTLNICSLRPSTPASFKRVRHGSQQVSSLIDYYLSAWNKGVISKQGSLLSRLSLLGCFTNASVIHSIEHRYRVT